MNNAMLNVSALVTACRRGITAAAVAGLAWVAVSSDAAAQQVIMVVNGDPITTFDVEQRTRFLQLANKKTPPRQEVIDELIDEKLKLQLPKRFDFSGSSLDIEADNAFNRMAKGMHQTPKEFIAQLANSGVQPGTLKSRIKAEIIWTQVIRGKFQSSFQFNDNEILKELETSKQEDQGGYDYTLRPILFVVPPRSPQLTIDTRRREAEALRARFENCNEGIPFARALREVIVRDQVTRSSADLPPPLREILEKTEVGRLTQPEQTQQGIEFYALCSKKQSNADNTPGKRAAREELYSKQFQVKSKQYLKELRAQAYIVYK
jgi:peptidyl-prolyl cis-trans isomerase SurA